ncbi:hypothetical protein EPUL_004152 [Erysiphe pulchra]|uniref:Uncharacterized protein n=1 Tax=Erysiphe pulchra TaxID=225359 RepID=A0A2S4PRB7_9PEZI|nr:hypothetical protein EPUL_004152 [Erysiphe pulchra]
MDGRQILKPVAPSKRPVTERPIQNSRDKSETENAFLPKELADIIATRQRRERAWHARLMLCTTVINNKEEAAALKAYIQLAIANFVASDSTPTPPKIPSHSRPKNSNRSSMGNEKNIMKKVAIAILRNFVDTSINSGKSQEALKLPAIPHVAEKTWATAARNDQKKARISLNTSKQGTSAIKSIQHPSTKDKFSKTASSDKRLFIRLPQEHDCCKLYPAGIREVVVQKLSISPSLIGKIKPVHSGFALSPCSKEARESTLNAGNGLISTGAKLEPSTNWIPINIPTVPRSIHKVQGQIEVSSSMLTDEIERVCSIRQDHVKLYGRNKEEAPHRTWIAYFAKAPRSGFRVFDKSGNARIFKRKQPLEFCKRCNGHHPTKNCSRAPSRGNCGSTNHLEDVCMATTKCRNCGGPHRSESRRCLARPNRAGAPTKEQIKKFRQTGEREYQAVLQAKAAEKSAASAEINNLDLTRSQDPDNIDNIPASPIEISTGDAMRL